MLGVVGCPENTALRCPALAPAATVSATLLHRKVAITRLWADPRASHGVAPLADAVRSAQPVSDACYVSTPVRVIARAYSQRPSAATKMTLEKATPPAPETCSPLESR